MQSCVKEASRFQVRTPIVYNIKYYNYMVNRKEHCCYTVSGVWILRARIIV
jgi:hypothetical protein